MANQWLRLWHDMPTDPKWRTISKASGQRIGDVMAVYVHLLVCASNATERGRTQSFNSEDVASALDLDTEQVDQIIAAMQNRVLDGDLLKGWESRQVAREDGSAERAKAWRESKKTTSKHTPNAPERNRTPEERRLEEIRKEEGRGGIPRATSADASEGMKSTGLQGVDPAHPKLSALLSIGITTAELVAASFDAVNKKKPFAYALATAEGRRRDSALSPLPAAAKADPDSRSAIEAEAIAKGLGPWNETEQWPTYKARVRGNPQPVLSLVALAGMAAQHQGATA